MELSQAKEIIKSAIDIAVQKGCFNINDVVTIAEALKKIESMQDIEFIANQSR